MRQVRTYSLLLLLLFSDNFHIRRLKTDLSRTACMIFFIMDSAQVFFSREGVDGADYLVIGLPLVLQRMGEQVVKIVLLCDHIDARVPSFEVLFQMRARHYVLIARPVEFDPRRSQPLLHVETPSAHGRDA